ncbi:GPI ethanolamine phosphate transferase 1 [Maniola hyperantus]|uniref:GPI ethanolamine phosphate transferase 1 n=1 Tax=Aphantopus hyperantus TaxID=2795564 RepID=UPI0015687657|nr:GPI ethanolamine phosphate transferase 1 [Maniola hyperantus]
MFGMGIFIHLVFLFSIFDIYFKSPIVNNANTYKPLHEAPADRLVLFVVDGLRAESFVNYTTMPYLRSVANNHGRWGISHTRVPTESRPGHVAIIAGFYEDPSAIAKGWKENPVDFDSVFNQSEFTWSWGTYDILEIFTKGAVKNNIFVEKLNPYDQSFSSDKNTTLLDDWVFTKVKDFFHKANYNEKLKEKLHRKKIVFFLHLLGTDTSGHTHKPKTKNFLATIKFVDENIREIEQIMKDFYNDDGKTTFLMTSDHGMTDWGSHGTGDDDETKTPYVLWGAGVQQVQDKIETLDPETHVMSLENRYDINQADLTPLMSTFISIPVPVNSIGQLPIGLLEMSLPNKAKAIYSNCRQMISQYNKKRLDVEASAIPILYQPFESFDGKKVQEIISFTEKLLEDEQYEKVVKLSEEIMHLSLSGLTYYHNYYQKPLLITVTLSFLGWIMCLLRFLIEQKMCAQTEMPRNKNQRIIRSFKTIDRVIKILAVFASMLLCLMIYVQSLPVQYYIYFLMPIFLWIYALTPVNLWIQTLNLLKNKRRIYFLGIEILCYTLGSIALGLALTHRWVLSIPLLGMSLWPFFSASIHKLPKLVCVAWPIGCVSLSVFSFTPVIGKDSCIELVVLAGLIWLLIHSMYIWKCLLPKSDDQDVMREMIISIIQIFLLALSLQIIYLQARRFEESLPISQTLQTVCWIVSVLLPLIPLLYTKKFINRLVGINTAILNFYLLLSVAHEGLFMVTLILNVNCWMFLEFKLSNFRNIKIGECVFEEETSSNGEKHLVCLERSINSQDFRRAFFYTLYIILAYFGTGNIASLNSFEVRWVLCFTTSFQPFVMTGLILLKTLSPFLSVACTFRAIQYLTKAPFGCLNMIVLIYSNIMGLHMLYHVRNTGSWLEIGTSISQYIIVQVITLFIVLINKIAKILTEIAIHSLIVKLFKNRKKYV